MKAPQLFLLIGIGAVSWAAEPLIYLNKPAIAPGETLKIQVPSQGNHPTTLTWGERTYPFAPTFDHFWRILAPVPVTQPLGKQTLYINVDRPLARDLVEGPLEIEVVQPGFRKEDLVFSKEKGKLLNNPDEESESQLIREMLKASLSDPKQRWRGLFLSPVPGKVLSAFGTVRNKVGQKTEDWHKGVDLAALAGTSVSAPNNGVVLLVKEFNFHGKTVLLSHGQGVGTIYLHLRSFAVKEGDEVKRGQKIGEVGSTGLATGPHLHWGLYIQGEPVDPMQWLKEEF